MTTIDHQQAAVDRIARVLFCMQHRLSENAYDMARFQGLKDAARREATNALTAAAPHLRAAWAEEASDGYHTFTELYEYRMLYNALAANATPHIAVKSWRHSDGEKCFGGGWFIVVMDLTTGQVTNHYEAKYWKLFRIPEVETAPEWDGHTPQQAAERIRLALLEGGAE